MGVEAQIVKQAHDEWASTASGETFAGPDGNIHWRDDEEFWATIEDRLDLGDVGSVQEAAKFRPHLHPRDRLGRFRDTPEFIRTLIPDAHIVGGAVRDKLLGKKPKDYDFLAPGMDHDDVRAALEGHGTVEDLIVNERHVGVRFWPDADDVDAPKEGIEIAPPRAEVSTGPGRHEFEIVADARVPVEDDMLRRDFTVNAIAESPDGTLIDPLNGARDAEKKVLRVVGETAFRDDGLRIIRGLRFISQHDLTPDDETLAQMTRWSHRIKDVSGHRVREEFHKLLMGANPEKALKVARDTGVLRHMFPEFAPAIGFEQQSRYHGLTADEHIFKVVQATADAGDPLPVRVAAFWHDAGKPESAWLGDDGKLHYYENPELGKLAHEDVSARIFERVAAVDRLAYPTILRDQVLGIVRSHMFQDHGKATDLQARKFRAKHGDLLVPWLLAHKRADIRGKEDDADEKMKGEIAKVDALAAAVESQRDAPVYTKDLLINGNDLILLGYTPGPEIGGALQAMLAQVIGNPTNNNREWLEREAKRLLKQGVPVRAPEKATGGTAANRAAYEEMFPQQMDVKSSRKEVVEYLQLVMSVRKRGGGAAGMAYAGPEDVVLNHGLFFRKKASVPKRDFPPDVCIPGQCFTNALTSAAAGDLYDQEWARGLTYVEGWAQPKGMIPVHHAWLVDQFGNVYDPTWDWIDEAVYAGVPFASEVVMKEAVKRGTDTMFDFEFPYETPIPKAWLVDIPGLPVREWVARHADELRDFDAETAEALGTQ